MQKKLNVIILTYNRADFLKEQLESVCEQTLSDFDITVLNNASTDNTIQVINDIKKRYPNRKIKVITHKKNIGNFGNFKKAQEIASGDYVCVLHDDDILHPFYLEVAMKVVEKQPEIGLVSGQGIFYVNPSLSNFCLPNYNVRIWPAKVSSLLSLYIERFTFQCAIYKTSIYKSVKMGMDEYGKLWDIIFLLDVMQLCPCAYLQYECIRIRFHRGQDSETNVNGPFVPELQNLLLHIKKLYSDYGWMGVIGLYNFAKFIFDWSKIKDVSWRSFRKSLIKLRVITPFEYFMIKNKEMRSIITFLAKRENIKIYKRHNKGK